MAADQMDILSLWIKVLGLEAKSIHLSNLSVSVLDALRVILSLISAHVIMDESWLTPA